MIRPLPLMVSLVFALPAAAGAVVIRDDVDDAEYRITDAEVEALVDLPHEGHGVLISPQWILTAAHAVQWHAVDEVMLGGMCLKVEKLVVHPGFTPAPEGIFDAGGDVDAAMRFQAGRDDVALIKLAAPVRGIAPMPLYRADGETGARMTVIGKGATGVGSTGFDREASHRTELRRAENIVASADARWLGYVFDDGPDALPREGTAGNGDSGGPLLITHEGRPHVAGITAWVFADGDIATFRPGRYGTTSYAARVSRYAGWIDGVIAEDAHRHEIGRDRTDAGAP